MFPIAFQLYSVRDDLEKDFVGTLEQVKKLGYDGVEFAGLYNQMPEFVKEKLDKLGLVPLSAHVPLNAMLADPSKILADYAKIGCTYLAIPYAAEEHRMGGAKYQELLDIINRIGNEAQKHGITLLYHNHDFEFAKFDGKYALDLLYEAFPPEILQCEIDICWVNVAGENPADYIRKYSGRTPVVHLKDFVMPGKKPEKLYALIGLDDEKQSDTVSEFEFKPVGSGVQNIPAVLEASKESGAKWVVVEQDMPTKGMTAMECAEASINYLKNLVSNEE